MTEMGKADLTKVETRFVLCSLDCDGRLRPMRPTLTHFDLFPSILTALGFTVEGSRLGFGYDVFSEEAVPPQGYMDTLKKRLLSPSKVYESLWFPEYTDVK